MLTLYHITDRATWKAHINFFHAQEGSHYIGLPDGRILVASHFQGHAQLEKWEAHPAVEALPHPIFEGNTPLDPKHVQALAHLGIKAGHTVRHVAAAVGKINPLMRLRHF